jgi:hypothetical protein
MFILFQIVCKLHFDKATWHLPNNPQNVNRDINNEDIVSYRNKSLLSCVFASVVKQLILQFFVWMCLLILRSGDVEINPGPGVSSTPRLLTSDTSLSDDCLRIDNLIYFTCLNIQSFISKRDIIQAELNHRDVLLFTETWFNQNSRKL